MNSNDEIIRWIDYYDLIEFPSGKHIPVPLAIEHVGLREVLKIPVAEKKRDVDFYYCEECDHEGYEPYSFFRCQYHKPITKSETRYKLALLEAFIHAGMHEFLKYIEIDPWLRPISMGRIEIKKTLIVVSYGKMIRVLR